MEQNRIQYNVQHIVKDLIPIINDIVSVDRWQRNPWSNSDNFSVYYNGGSTEIIYYCDNINEDGTKVYKSNNSLIEYNFNKDGFRTENFKNIDNKKINILTAGCSNTFGQSMPEKYLWSNILKNNFNKDNIQLYNLGISGLDTARIISNCYNFINIYGKPDYLFLLLPPIQRSLVLNKNKEMHTRQEPLFVRNMDDFVKNMFKNKSKLPIFLYNNLIHLVNLETFCSINNIKLIWHSWDSNAQAIYQNCSFKNNISNEEVYNEIQNIINLYKKENNEILFNPLWEFAEDNDHQGLKWHTAWANVFYKKAEHYDNFRN